MKAQLVQAEQKDRRPEPERKIIKFDSPEKSAENKNTVVLPQDTKKKIESIPEMKAPGATADAAREDLEQRRMILQNMKDFDFQIKKNQEDLTNLNEKVENLSKDLDDLVSLYEIVSEQMNPFVGLSKVTKKRIDALENFTKEVDNVKNRIGDLESLFEKSGITPNGGVVRSVTNAKPSNNENKSFETVKEPTEITNTDQQTSLNNSAPKAMSTIAPSNSFSGTTEQPFVSNLSDPEVDELLTKSLESLVTEQRIDTIINEFFLSLK